MKDFMILYRVECKLCSDILVSKKVHDYVCCSCNSICIDGGATSPNGRWVKDKGNIIDRSVYSSAPFEKIRENLYRNGETLLKDMSNDWLVNCIEYEKENKPNNPYLRFYKEELEYREIHNIYIEE